METKEGQKKRHRVRLYEGEFIVGEEKEDREAEKEEKRRTFFRSVGLATELGFLIAIPLSGGVFLGVWLDSIFSTHPKLTLSLLGLGVIVSFANLFIVLSEFSKKE